MTAFALFILPSNKEGVGSILMDAMSVGLPIVASRVGGVPEIVIDNGKTRGRNFSADIMSQKYLEIYRSTLEID